MDYQEAMTMLDKFEDDVYVQWQHVRPLIVALEQRIVRLEQMVRGVGSKVG